MASPSASPDASPSNILGEGDVEVMFDEEEEGSRSTSPTQKNGVIRVVSKLDFPPMPTAMKWLRTQEKRESGEIGS